MEFYCTYVVLSSERTDNTLQYMRMYDVESREAPPLTAGLAALRPTKAPPRASLQVQVKGDLLQVVNAPGGSGKTLALATLLAEQEEIRSRNIFSFAAGRV